MFSEREGQKWLQKIAVNIDFFEQYRPFRNREGKGNTFGKDTEEERKEEKGPGPNKEKEE